MNPAMLGILGNFLMSSPNADQTPLPGADKKELLKAQPSAGGLPDVSNTGEGLAVAGRAQAESTANQAAAQQQMLGSTKRAGEAVKTANTAQTEAALQEAGVAAPLYKDYYGQMQTREQDFAARQAELQKRANDQFDDYLRTSRDYQDMHVYNWWSNSNTGAQVLGIISQTLAGAAMQMGGTAGGPTPLDRIIQQDLDRQKMEIAKTGQIADNAGNMYGKIKAQVGDEAQAESIFREVAANSVKQRAMALIASLPELQKKKAMAALAVLNADLDQKTVASQNAIRGQLLDEADKTAFQTAGLALQGGTAQDEIGAKRAVAQGNLKGGLARAPGSEYLDPEIKKQLGTQLEGEAQARDSLTRIQGYLQEIQASKRSGGPNVDSTELWNAIRSEVTNFQTTWKDVKKLGALSEGDMRLADSIANIPTGRIGALQNFFGTNPYSETIARLNAVKSAMRAGVRQAVSQYSVPSAGGGMVPLHLVETD